MKVKITPVSNPVPDMFEIGLTIDNALLMKYVVVPDAANVYEYQGQMITVNGKTYIIGFKLTVQTVK